MRNRREMAAAARFIVEDRFTLSAGEAERLVESFQELRHSLRTTEEEVRRTERLLASVVRSVEDCIFTTDIEGRLVTVNPAGERLFGATEAELAGAAWRELLARVPAGRVRAGADGGAYAWKGEVRARARTGREFPAHLAVAPILDPAGRVLNVDGLRVADASVMPVIPRGNTNIPTLMVAEKMAAAITNGR